jgi:two-component system cell cycle response regulator DivK
MTVCSPAQGAGIPVALAKVLVVEDNAFSMFALLDLLRHELGVAYAMGRPDGNGLFELIAQEALTPDLVLLDLQIPREDGYAVLRRIRASPALRTATVAAVTANVLHAEVQRARLAGFDGFIGKPIDDDARFCEQISRLLRREAVWEPR